MIPWKVFWTATGAVLTAALVALMALQHLPTAMSVGILAAAAAVFAVAAWQVVYRADMFEPIKPESRQVIVRLLAGGASIHVAWGVVFLLRPDMWLLWFVALAAVAGLEYGVARANEYMLTQLKPTPAKAKEVAVVQVEENPEQAATAHLKAAFEMSGHEWLDIRSAAVITSGLTQKPVGRRFILRIPAKMATTAGKGKRAEVVKLDATDAEKMAIALSNQLGLDLHSSWVTLTKEPAAGTYLLAVLLEDALAETYVFVDEPEWTTIETPSLDGYEVDGTPHYSRLDQHGADTGQSRMGKSSRVNCKYAHVTRCRNAQQWVCGVVKLYDGLAGWLEPYHDQPYKHPFGWIASGPEDTLIMLATAYVIARWRQNQPMHKRADFVKIILELDEAPTALQMTHVTITIDGVEYTMSKLAKDHLFGGGSAGVYLHFAGQRTTDPNWGAYSTDINSGLMWRTVFRTGDIAEIGRATGGWDLPNPEHKGEYWSNPGADAPIKKLKAPYMQEIDPSKPKLHDGPTISDVAWARRHFHVDLDEGSAKVAREFAGAVYEDRHQYVTDEMLSYITKQSVVSESAPSSFDEAKSQVLAELDEIAANADWSTPAAPVPRSGGVATMVAQRTLRERVLAILAEADDPMAPAEIMAALREDGGPETTDQTVTNLLTSLSRDGGVEKPTRGLYKAS